MFNTTTVVGGAKLKLSVNAISGTIVKNYRDSFITKFKGDSDYAKHLLSNEPRIITKGKYSDQYVPVVVIQVMILPDNRFIAEIMYKEDFDKLFEEEEVSET